MKKLNIGLIGAGFMAKAHSIAYAGMPMFFWPAPAIPVKKTVMDVDETTAKEAKQKFNFEKYSTNWFDIINDPSIDVVDICTPNNAHFDIAIAAASRGKHILCEKPLALTAEQAKAMYIAAKKNSITTMVAYNYRKTPAIQLAKKFINEGLVGDILDFRGTYLQDWSADPSSPLSWRFQKELCGSGALGDIGTHVIDMIRFLVGDFDSVNARTATYVNERPIQSSGADTLGTIKIDNTKPKHPVDVDDQCCFMIHCKNKAFGTIEATRNAWGRNNFITIEIHGTKGSIYFNYERRDELQICFADDNNDRRGFKTIYTGPSHPYGDSLWPIPALGIGYTETKIIECYDFCKAIIEDSECTPNFRDGYAIELIADAVLASSKSQTWVKVKDIEES